MDCPHLWLIIIIVNKTIDFYLLNHSNFLPIFKWISFTDVHNLVFTLSLCLETLFTILVHHTHTRTNKKRQSIHFLCAYITMQIIACKKIYQISITYFYIALNNNNLLCLFATTDTTDTAQQISLFFSKFWQLWGKNFSRNFHKKYVIYTDSWMSITLYFLQ